MKIYLSARYSRRKELCRYREDLQRLGHEVTSRWLNGNHQIDDAGLSIEAKAEERQRFASEDFADTIAADMTITFTEPPRTTNSRGGRHVEFGIAMGRMQRVWVVGPAENVFHCHEDIRRFDDWQTALASLTHEAAT